MLGNCEQVCRQWWITSVITTYNSFGNDRFCHFQRTSCLLRFLMLNICDLWDVHCIYAGFSMLLAHLLEECFIDSVLLLQVISSLAVSSYRVIWKAITLKFCLFFYSSLLSLSEGTGYCKHSPSYRQVWATAPPAPSTTRGHPSKLEVNGCKY